MKNVFRIGWLAIALLVSTAHADTLVSAEDPEAILNIAKGYGSAVLTTDSSNDPFITGRIEGTKYGIVFYGCSNGRNCDDILFSAGWSGIEVSIYDINAWNRTKKFGKAYLDNDGDPMLEMAVNLDYGITHKNLDDTFNRWVIALKGFKQQVLKQ